MDICGDRMAVAEGGQVNIYQRTAAGWKFQAKVAVSSQLSYIADVEIAGDVLAVGCIGTVQIYEQDPVTGVWNHRVTLTDPANLPDSESGWVWGRSLYLDHNVLVVGGTVWAITQAPGFVSVFERSIGAGGSNWLLRDHLVNPDPMNDPSEVSNLSHFGMAIAGSGQTFAVASFDGRVWIYRQDAAAGRHWRLDGPALPLGGPWVSWASLALDGDTLAIGDSLARTLRLYQRRPAGWIQQATFPMPENAFIALDGGLLVVRDQGESGSEIGVSIYERASGTWRIRQGLRVAGAGVGYYDSMYDLLALSGGTVVCGAPFRAGLSGPHTGAAVVISATNDGSWGVSEVIAPAQQLTVANIGSNPTLGSVTTGMDPDRVVFTAKGYGAAARADQFGFVPLTLLGDGEIRARILSQVAVSPGVLSNQAIAGVMLRETFAPGSRSMLLGLTPTGLSKSWRSETGGWSVTRSAGAGAAPMWARLVRKGVTITGYVSTDGQNWIFCGVHQIPVTGPMHAGLVLSNSSTQAAVAVFDAVQVLPQILAPTTTGPG